MTAFSPSEQEAARQAARRAGAAASGGWREWLPRVAFVLALTFAAFAFGFITGGFRLPPFGLIQTSFVEVRSFIGHWRNDLGLAPDRHLVPAEPGRARLTLAAPARMAPGLRLVAGLFPGEDALNAALLLDAKGRELHRWPIDYTRLDPGGRDAGHVFLHGLAPLADGSLVVNFDTGNVLSRIDACGRPLWTLPGPFHHVVTPAPDGTLWTWRKADDEPETKDQLILQVDAESGRVLREISLLHDVILAHRAQGVFGLWTRSNGKALELIGDPFHPNDVEPLSPAMAAAFPGFEAGDLLISLRNLNMVAVLDGETLAVKWWRVGPWHRQHDPDFTVQGRISIFDNQMSVGASRIMEIDPANGRTEVAYGPAEGFYSWRRGKHQRLANDNILITEAEAGRVFEIDPEGRVLWDFQNIYDEARNGVLNSAMVLREDFFAEGALDCAESLAAR